MKASYLITSLLRSSINCCLFIKDSILKETPVNILQKAKQEIFTNIDIGSQYIFYKTLKEEINEKIKLIAEEDFSDMRVLDIVEKNKIPLKYFVRKRANVEKINTEVEKFINDRLTDEVINLNECLLLVDPIDATWSLINRHYENVTCLIGVLRNFQPYFGIVGSPFIDNKKIKIYFNIPNKGVFKLEYSILENSMDVDFNITEVKKVREQKPLKIIGSDSDLNILQKKITMGDDGRIHSLRSFNGMGHRAIRILEDDYVYLALHSGACGWDVAAPDCILRELGGGLKLLDNTNLDYSSIQLDCSLKKKFFLYKNENQLSQIMKIVKDFKG